MKKFIKPVDIVVVAVIVICSLLITWLFAYDGAKYAVVYVDGNEYGRYSLNKDEKQIIEISSSFGRNVIEIEKGKVLVLETTCPDKTEINAGAISKSGQSLVCLPNRLVISIEGRIVTDATAF